MQANKTSLLDHLRWARAAVLERHADCLVGGATLHLAVRSAGLSCLLHPRTLDRSGSIQLGVPSVEDHVSGFAGWLPYGTREWELADDARRLNAFLRQRGILAPDLYSDDVEAPVLVRRPGPSKPHTVRGPYRTTLTAPLDATADEYYEAFITGSRVRLWFWNGAPLCGELHDMPSIRADGSSSLRDLIVARAVALRPIAEAEEGGLLARLSPILDMQSWSLASVPPAGTRIAIDHLIDSPVMHPSERQTFFADEEGQPAWLSAAKEAGEELRAEAPSSYRDDLLFTLDGVIDTRGELWVREMDLNPIVHPAMYPAIIDTVLQNRLAAPT